MKKFVSTPTNLTLNNKRLWSNKDKFIESSILKEV